MADVITLSNGTTTYDLMLASSHRLLQHLATPPPAHAITYSGTRRRDGRRPAFSVRENRALVLPVLVRAGTKTLLHDLVSNINLLLQQATGYFQESGTIGARVILTVQPDGATNASVFEVLAGVLNPLDWAQASYFRTPPLIIAQLELQCSPFAEEVTLVTDTATIRSIDLKTVSSVRGEVETPARFLLQLDQAVSNPLVWLGRKHRGTVANFLYKLRGETGTHTGHTVTNVAPVAPQYTYSTVVDAAASDGNYGRWTTGATAATNRLGRWEITSNRPDHYGQYRVRARLKGNAGTPYFLQLYYGTNTTPTKSAAGVLSTTLSGSWRYVDLGIITWPDMTVPAVTAVSNLVLELELNPSGLAAATTLDLDHLLLIPVDEGYIEFTLSGALAFGDRIWIDGRSMPESIYVTNSSSEIKTNITPTIITGAFPKIAPGTQVFAAGVTNTSADVLADTFLISAEFLPRYHWLRGS